MKYTIDHIATILFGALFLASCASMEPTAHVRDDVYFMPSDQPLAQAPLSESTGEPLPPPPVDYYDADEAKAYSDDRGYYDIVHNDPHYYNQSRFGFGMGMGSMGGGWGMHHGMGWGMGHGMGMGWGMGHGMGMGWGSPWGMGMGMGWGSPWGMGYRPWGWHRPWGMYDPWGMYSPWGMGMGMGMGGWGYGPYMGPWGNCFSCYQPLGYFESGTPRTVGHRPSLSGGSGGHSGSGPVTGNRMMARDPAGLIPATTGRPGIGSRPTETREARPTNTRPNARPTQGRPVYSPPGNRDQYRGQPNYQRPQNAPQRTRPSGTPSTRPSGTPSTRPSSRPQRNDGGTRPRSTFGGDRSGGSTPSRSIGGGGGGGSRSGGSLRPR